MHYASLVILIDNKGRGLTLKRSSHSSFPSQWGLPGGRAEEGEEDWETAIRELREETSVVISKEDLNPLTQIYSRDKFFHFFWAKCEAPEIILDSEHTDWLWIPKDELKEVISIPTDEAVWIALKAVK